ncbi:hypothetical protein ACHAPT_004985 [Fusarium lateritium]
MARRPFFFLSPWLIFCVTAVLAAGLPSEVGRFIPSCAEECLVSFLSVNYASTGCAGSLSMDCMCSRIGATGFTLGEGAMQCISAERSVGYCTRQEASDRVIEQAYDMCNGRPNAINPTQRTITATLVLAPSGGVITFPSVTVIAPTATNEPQDGSYSTSTSQTLPTTLVVDTSSPPPLPITKASTKRSSTKEHDITSSDEDSQSSTSEIAFITEPPTTSASSTDEPTTLLTRKSSTSSSTSTTETAATTSTEAPAGGAGGKGDDEKGSGKLSSEQVAGISVGVLAAAGVAAGAIVLARYYRRKNHPKAKTGFLPMRDTWGYKPEHPRNGGGGGGGGHDSWMIHQMRRTTLDPSAPPPPPPSYNGRSLRPGTLALAISPAPSSRGTPHPSPLRRISKLLPAKPSLPSLPLKINKEKSPPLLQPEWEDHEHHRNASSSSRDSVSHMQAMPSLASAAGVGSPSRTRPTPPKLHITTSSNRNTRGVSNNNRESNVTEFEEDRTSFSANTGSTQVWRPPPTTPISAGTFYVADQYGNWVLGNSKRASVIARGSQGSKESQEAVPPKPPPKDDVNSSAAAVALARSRSLAPPAEIRPAGVPPKEKPAGPRPQHPSPFFSSQTQPRRNMTARRSMTRNLTRPREDSSSSSNVTILNTSPEGPAPVAAAAALSQEQQATLSPVVESPPRHPQPRIPPRDPRRMSQMSDYNRRSGPPTRQVVYNPPGQPSPTLGMMQGPDQQQPLDEPEVIPNVGLEKDSPSMRLVDPSPPPNEEEAQNIQPMNPNQARGAPFYFDPPYPQPLNTIHQPVNTSHASQHRRSASGPQAQTYRPYQRPPSFQRPPSHKPSPRPQQSNWQTAQRLPQPYQAFQQQQHVQAYQRPHPNQSLQREPPQGYQSFQPDPPYPRNSAYQSFQYPQPPPQQQQQPLQVQQHSHIHPSRVQYQTYNPSQTAMSQHSSSQTQSSDSSLLAKRLGSDRAANMSIGTDSLKSSKWRRENPELTPPGFPLSPHWKPTLTPTRRGDDLYLNVQ